MLLPDPPDYQPPEPYAVPYLGPHGDHGGWWEEKGQAVCACGEMLSEREAA